MCSHELAILYVACFLCCDGSYAGIEEELDIYRFQMCQPLYANNLNAIANGNENVK